MKVELYWNIPLKKYSVKALEGEHKGKVFTYARYAEVIDAEFVVQPSGQKRVRESGQKNVHAFVRGLITDDLSSDYAKKMLWRRVRYNPHVDDFFMVQKFSDMSQYKPIDKNMRYAVRLEIYDDKPRIYI